MEFSLTTKYRNYYELHRFTKNYYVLRGVIRITMNLPTIHEFVRINRVTTKYLELLGVARNHSTNGPWIAGQPAGQPAGHSRLARWLASQVQGTSPLGTPWNSYELQGIKRILL